MSLNRTMSTVIGLCVLGFAGLILVSPAFEDRVPTATAVAKLGNDYLLVAVVAGLTLLAMIGVLLVRTATGVTEATPPAVEGVTPEAPGQEFDAALDSVPPIEVTDRHRRIHERLRITAIAAIAESRHCSRETARELVDRCEWTDDPDAAAFLADKRLDPPSVIQRLETRLRGDGWFDSRVRTTVTALEALEEEQS